MEELKYWLAFNSIDGLGAVSIMKIWKHFNSMKEAWSASASDFYEIEALQNNLIEKIITSRPNLDPALLLEKTLEHNVKILCILDEGYPELLKSIYDPPVILYYQGNLSCCDLKRTIGIVGTRTPTDYGKEMATKISRELCEYGITIVSGLAEGIDTSAHSACLKAKGKTIAVLGSGLNYIYPKSNNYLAQKIIEENNGAILSEYPPDAKPEGWRFPYRNRVISGLSKAIIVVESKSQGGGLITAKSALEQGREVFGVSSRVLNNSNDGVHNLIHKGEARIFTTYKRFFDFLHWEIIASSQAQEIEETDSQKIPPPTEISFQEVIQAPPERESEKVKNIDTQPPNPIPADIKNDSPEAIVLNCLDLEPLPFDVILAKSDLNAPKLLSTLTMLELRGLIIQTSGKRYKKKF